MKLALAIALFGAVILPNFSEGLVKPRKNITTTTTATSTTVRSAPLGSRQRTKVPLDAYGNVMWCNCIALYHFSPVCGTDGTSFRNPQVLECAQLCGYDVYLDYIGNCSPE